MSGFLSIIRDEEVELMLQCFIESRCLIIKRGTLQNQGKKPIIITVFQASVSKTELLIP